MTWWITAAGNPDEDAPTTIPTLGFCTCWVVVPNDDHVAPSFTEYAPVVTPLTRDSLRRTFDPEVNAWPGTLAVAPDSATITTPEPPRPELKFLVTCT